MTADITALYQQAIREHSRSPRFRRIPESDCRSNRLDNSNCGDWIEIFISDDSERIHEVCFQGEGCALAMAGADILCGLLSKMTKSEAVRLLHVFPEAIDGNADAEAALPAEVKPLLAVRDYPGRRSCVLLAWDVAAKLFPA